MTMTNVKTSRLAIRGFLSTLLMWCGLAIGTVNVAGSVWAQGAAVPAPSSSAAPATAPAPPPAAAKADPAPDKQPWTRDQVIQVFSGTAQTLTSLAALAVALFAFIASKRSYTAQSRASLLAHVNDFNALALENNECLASFEEILHGTPPTDLNAARIRWAAYSFLNNRQLHFFMARSSHTNQAYLDQDKQNLERLMQNPVVRQCLRSGGYDTDFVAHCEKYMVP